MRLTTAHAFESAESRARSPESESSGRHGGQVIPISAKAQTREVDAFCPAVVHEVQKDQFPEPYSVAHEVRWPVKEPPRGTIFIEDVTPEVDGGRYNIKRVVGDEVRVEATLLKEGHGLLAGRVRWKKVGPEEGPERSAPMWEIGNHRWAASFHPDEVGRYAYTIEAWPDVVRHLSENIRKTVEAKKPMFGELLEVADRLAEAGTRARGQGSQPDAEALLGAAQRIRELAGSDELRAAGIVTDPALVDLASKYPDMSQANLYNKTLEVTVDPEIGRFSTWYELFSRSYGGFTEELLAREKKIGKSGLGFNVLYLPPIHPVGEVARKGPNNSLEAKPGDPGSPWAIKDHRAIDPAQGELADFQRAIGEAKRQGLHVAMDFVVQAAADHPDVEVHPSWFNWRQTRDGKSTLVTAENGPKKYQDVTNYNFNLPDAELEALIEHHLETLRFWCGQGVDVWRVDNPHTKPTAFWERVIRQIQDEFPGTIFAAEAYTYPELMTQLGKIGFTVNNAYATWRNSPEPVETKHGWDEGIRPYVEDFHLQRSSEPTHLCSPKVNRRGNTIMIGVRDPPRPCPT